MIVKQSTKALDMEEVAHLFAEGALKHLTHRERSNLLKEKRGMDGERKVAHILDRHFHQSDDHAVIHDLRIEEALATSGSKKTRKAGDLIEISSGISKRTLPDGRVAFLAAKGDLIAIERVRNACKGRGQWKPLFGNWVCDGDVALLVERIIAEPEGKAL